MCLSRTVSEIYGDFSWKSQKFPTLLFFVPAEGVPLGIGYRRWESENQNDGATGPTKKFDDIFSRLGRMHERDRETDRRTERWTDTGPQQRPRLRITSCGKNAQLLEKKIAYCENASRRLSVLAELLVKLTMQIFLCTRKSLGGHVKVNNFVIFKNVNCLID